MKRVSWIILLLFSVTPLLLCAPVIASAAKQSHARKQSLTIALSFSSGVTSPQPNTGLQPHHLPRPLGRGLQAHELTPGLQPHYSPISSPAKQFQQLNNPTIKQSKPSPPPAQDFSWVRDTVYTLMPFFIEVNLTTQKGYLYSRNEPVKEFGLSSGTSKLEDGVDTKTGLFVIQSKMEKWYSRQFDSTLMLNWMGFNWGIGFHALQGRGYYKYLGKKKSSHGCVRLTRDMAKELYTRIEEGTPVLVHDGHSAVKVAFCDSSEAYAYMKLSDLKYQLKKRLTQIYSGQYFMSYNPKLIIDFNNVGHEGLPIGDSRKIMKQQITLPVSEYISSSTPPPLGCTTFYRPLDKVLTTMQYKSFN